MTLFRAPFLLLLLAAYLAADSAISPLVAQSMGPSTGGAVRLAQELRFGPTSRRVLVIGAHPDDEDTDLVTVLTRGMGVETAYLSLTRGEGGQNLIGTELGTALGVLRSQELLAARALDGAQQFFTRAYDFGFSKSAEAAFAFWPRDDLTHDIVAVIRRFKPQIVISVWQGTPADGHGQHQVSGLVARDAFDAAGDPQRYPDTGGPWQVSKFYRSVRGGQAAEGLIAFNTGGIDPAIGQSFHQIAARSRSQHRSQDMGQYQEMGPASTAIRLEARAPGLSGSDDSLFAGITPELRGRTDPHHVALRLAQAGVMLDAYVDDDEVVPGQTVRGVLSIWNTGTDTVYAKAYPSSRGGWQHKFEDCPFPLTPIAPGVLFTCAFTSKVWDGMLATSPYYLRANMKGAFYHWDWLGGDWGVPFQPSELWGKFTILTRGDTLTVDQPIQARRLDQGLGEVRRPVQIVPRVSVRLSPDRLLWPTSTSHGHLFRVSLEHLARDSSTALVSLQVPTGWKVDPPKSVTLRGEGVRVAADFLVTAPATVLTGNYEIKTTVVVGNDTIREGVYRVDYPHVEQRNLISLASAEIVMADVALPRVAQIGYIRGAADRIPEALSNSGVTFRLLSGTEVQGVVLDSLKTLVIGPRAYEIDTELTKAHSRILRWVEAGGILIIQYQQYQFIQGGYAPLPLTIASPHDRVTEPQAPVTLLDANHALLRVPNRIGAADFEDWIQERGLYFARSWDPQWKPLLELHDHDDQPREGALLVASLGKGSVVYTGLSFFREIPAAVPGAWRLFMNLLSYGRR